jgi:ferric-dicitrate binding protein FerR (iron transport regulator)
MMRVYFLSGWMLLAIAGSWHCGNRPSQPQPQPAAPAEKPVDSLYQGGGVYRNEGSTSRAIRLEDGTEITLSGNTTLRLSKSFNKQKRECQLDGEAFFHVKSDPGKPFAIFTRNLQIFVLGTKFRVDAFANNAGEEVDVLEGKVKVQKSYHSTTDNEPELLTAGDMVMINRDIDLMEKEKLDSIELKKLGAN